MGQAQAPFHLHKRSLRTSGFVLHIINCNTRLTGRSNVSNVTASLQLQAFYKSSSINKGHSCLLTFADLRDCGKRYCVELLDSFMHYSCFLKNFRQPGLFSANSSDA